MAHLIFSPSISHIFPNCYPIVFLKLVDSCIIRLAPPSQALVFTLQITRCWTQLFSAHDRYTLSFELTHRPPCLSFCCLLLHNIYSVFCRLPFQTRPLGVLSSPIVSAKSGKGWASLFWWRHNSLQSPGLTEPRTPREWFDTVPQIASRYGQHLQVPWKEQNRAYHLLCTCCGLLSKPRPQGFFRPTHFLREKSWGRSCCSPSLIFLAVFVSRCWCSLRCFGNMSG